MDAQTTGGVTTTFGWDDASRLVSWSRGAEGASYTYDGNGQRTSATVTAGGATTTSTYTYDGITLLSLDAVRSDETTFSVAYPYDEDGRPYAGVYRAGTSTPVTFLIATNDNRMAWDANQGRWGDEASYRRVQRVWAIGAVVLWALMALADRPIAVQ